MKIVQDDLLIRRAAKGDEQAFEKLLLEHEKNVYNLCYRMAGNPDDALDLSQEAFLKAWRALSTYQFDAAFSTWLYRLTTNVCLDFLRKRNRQAHSSLTTEDENEEPREYSVPDPAPGPEEQAVSSWQQEAVQAAMQQLPEDYRLVLQLRVVEDLPYEQIADVMGIPVGTVKSRLSRARLQLKKLLEAGNFFDSEASEKMATGGAAR
ncbi:MAG: sigma-70 family RNA polymerase sigma factor [Clostridia bacterium]|nr:sigma-70 family RNA polymerase sigma factor [Clostridia bacterium]